MLMMCLSLIHIYVNPNEKRLRDVYINAKAIGNARHPLYIYNKQARKATSNPNQHLLTTDEMLKAFEWMGEDVAYEVVVENTNKLKLLTEPIFCLLYTSMTGRIKILFSFESIAKITATNPLSAKIRRSFKTAVDNPEISFPST